VGDQRKKSKNMTTGGLEGSVGEYSNCVTVLCEPERLITVM